MTRRLKQENDPFADALESYWLTGRGSFRYTRDDGLSAVEDAWWYFTRYPDFLTIEKKALRYARGRVLDVGCGAGRHALYLEGKGHRVTCIDASPRVAAIASQRGLADVRVASACGRLPFTSGEFDTVLLFGNNLGLCGSRRGVAKMLRELARVTSARGRILATAMSVGTFDACNLKYWNRALRRGREFGVARYRLEYQGKHPRWVSLLLLAPSELVQLAWGTGWEVTRLFEGKKADDGYGAVLEKQR